jgi:hypothetical protein
MVLAEVNNLTTDDPAAYKTTTTTSLARISKNAGIFNAKINRG